MPRKARFVGRQLPRFFQIPLHSDLLCDNLGAQLDWAGSCAHFGQLQVGLYAKITVYVMEEIQGFDLQLLDGSEVLIAETVGRPALFVDQDEEPSDHVPVAAMPLSVRADSEADLFLNLTDDDGHASAAAAAAEVQQPGQGGSS